MTEVLSGGSPDHQPRWPAALAGSVVAVLLVMAGCRQLTHHGAPAASPTPAPSTRSRTPPTLPVRTQPTVLPSTGTAASVLPGASPAATAGPRAQLAGPTGTLPAGVDLLLGTSAFHRLGSRSTALPAIALTASQQVAAIQPMGSGALVTVWDDGLPSGPAPATFYLVRAGAAPRRLGSGNGAIASADGRSLFAWRYGESSTSGNRLQQVDLTGRVLNTHQMPLDWQLASDTPQGLVVAEQHIGRTRILLVDRATVTTRQVLGAGGYLLGVGGTQVAWTSDSCQDACSVVTLDLVSGRQRTFTAAPGGIPAQVAFRPDGERFAISYAGLGQHDVGGPAAGFVEVVDPVSGRRTPVPGVLTDEQPASLAWTPDGRWLALAVRVREDVTTLGLWPSADGQVRVLTPQVRGGGAYEALLAL